MFIPACINFAIQIEFQTIHELFPPTLGKSQVIKRCQESTPNMATPNKFSNPDTDCKDCPCFYFNCLVLNPLQAILCLPFVCCARAIENSEKNKNVGDVNYDIPPPAKHPPMVMVQGDASKPRSQWPQDWHGPVARGAAQTADASTLEGTAVGDGVQGREKSAKMKFVGAAKKAVEPVWV